MTDDKLEQIISLLKDEITRTEDTAKVSLMVETGEDEALAIGTENAFLRMAMVVLQSTLQCKSDSAKSIDFDGVKLPSTNHIEQAFDNLAHVVPRTLCLSENENIQKRAVSYLHKIG